MNGPSRLVRGNATRQRVRHGSLGSGVMEAPGSTARLAPIEFAAGLGGSGDGGSIFDHGGPVLGSVHVKPIFWGTAWFQPWLHPGPSAGDVLWAMKSIFMGPFMSGLSQYRGIGKGSVLGEIFVSMSEDPPNPFSQTDLENMLRSLTTLPDGRLLNPSLDNQLLCCVFTPPGWTSADAEAAGFHAALALSGSHVPYAWVSSDGTLDFVSSVYSHELAESCTDPNLSTFYDDTGACGETGACEISDYCYGSGVGRGWSKIGGVLLQGYWSTRDARCILPPERVIPGLVSGNPALIQGRFLSRGNFEMVVPLRDGGLAHYSRVNDDPALPWVGPTIFGSDVGTFDSVTMIQSNFTAGGQHGNLEVVAKFGGQLLFYWREDVPPYTWHGPTLVPLSGPGQNAQIVTGNPSLIQGRFGGRGNFEMVVPLAGGGIAHYSRVNDLPGLPWSGPSLFAVDIGIVDAVALAQSNLSSSGGGAGDLHVAARTGSELLLYHRDDAPPYVWRGPEVISLNAPSENTRMASGIPSLVFQNFGSILNGYDQVVTPLAGGGFGHLTRDNNSPGMAWEGPAIVAPEIGPVESVSLIHSNFSSSNSGVGNLELVAMPQNQLVHFWREDNSQIAGNDSRSWFGPWLVTD
jgi:hypothetical protein